MIRPIIPQQIESLLTQHGHLKSYWYETNSSRGRRCFALTGFDVEESKFFGRAIVYHNIDDTVPLETLSLERTRALVKYAETLKDSGIILTPGYTKDKKHLWYLECLGFDAQEVMELAQLTPGTKVEVDGASWAGYTPVFIRYEAEGDWCVVGLQNRNGYSEYRVKFNKIIRILPPGVS